MKTNHTKNAVEQEKQREKEKSGDSRGIRVYFIKTNTKTFDSAARSFNFTPWCA